jgi:hypothetical protein
VENRECRLIFLLERAGKQKARFLKKKVGSIPEMGTIFFRLELWLALATIV